MCVAQDNAPSHVARATHNMLAANRVRTIPWPAASPDLNPIENVCDWLKREVRRNQAICRSCHVWLSVYGTLFHSGTC